MSTWNRLDLQTLGCQPISPKNLHGHCCSHPHIGLVNILAAGGHCHDWSNELAMAFGNDYSSSCNEPTLTFNTMTFVSSPSFYLRLSSSVQFTICVGHKIIGNIAYATMGPLEFLMMSPLYKNDGNNCSNIFLLFNMNTVSEVIQKKFTNNGGHFHIRVICEGLYTKMFEILTHKFVTLYGFKNIE